MLQLAGRSCESGYRLAAFFAAIFARDFVTLLFATFFFAELLFAFLAAMVDSETVQMPH
ncbi:MAG: hypothetical protein ACT4P6_13295 [Gemmatimonadaceae bacterium]